MGDPRRLRKKYETPVHPWQKETIDAERALKNEYHFKNKTELWKINSALKGFKNQAKKLIAARGTQADRERMQLMKRLERLGLLNPGAKLDDILSLTSKNILERRLQSMVYRRGLAHSMKQARQFITHNHIMVGGKKVNAPNYIVGKSEEEFIAFAQRSPFINPEHPERVPAEQKQQAKKQEAPVEPEAKAEEA